MIKKFLNKLHVVKMVKNIHLLKKFFIIITIFIVINIFLSRKIIYYNDEWLTPFESIKTTIYDLGDGFTSKTTTKTIIKINSVNKKDKKIFSNEQWNQILIGIENGEIAWED